MAKIIPPAPVDGYIWVVAVCDHCRTIYWQRVRPGTQGKTLVPRMGEYWLKEMCEASGFKANDKPAYFVWRCRECSLKSAPPALRDALAKVLGEGEMR